MEILLLAGVGGGIYWMYANYKRNKKKIEALTARVKRIEEHLGLPPMPQPPEPAD